MVGVGCLGLGVESTWEFCEGLEPSGWQPGASGGGYQVSRQRREEEVSSEGKKQKSEVRYGNRVAIGEGPGLCDPVTWLSLV